MLTPDGQDVLVGSFQPGPGGSASLDVFHETDGTFKRMASMGLPSKSIEGVALVPGTHTLALGLGEVGVGFLPLADALQGKGKVLLMPLGSGIAAGLLSPTADGKMIFAGDEYGDGGAVTAIALRPDADGRMHLAKVGRTLTPRANAGLTTSPDSKRVYATGEIIRQDIPATLAGHGIAALQRSGCMQKTGGKPQSNGVLYVIDASSQKILQQFDAGCSPTRDIVSADGKTLYVTARGDDKVLVFDTEALEKNPAHAFLRAIPTGGSSPVGLALFDGGKKLLVANSNRFANGSGTATVIDLSDPAAPKVVQTIPTGDFPRNIDVSADGRTLAMTVFASGEVMVLKMK